MVSLSEVIRIANALSKVDPRIINGKVMVGAGARTEFDPNIIKAHEREVFVHLNSLGSYRIRAAGHSVFIHNNVVLDFENQTLEETTNLLMVQVINNGG